MIIFLMGRRAPNYTRFGVMERGGVVFEKRLDPDLQVCPNGRTKEWVQLMRPDLHKFDLKGRAISILWCR